MNGEQNNLPEEKRQEETKPGETLEKAPQEIGDAYRAERKRMHAEEKRKRFGFGRLLIGLFLVFFGIFLLGKSAGLIPQEINIDIFQFWPLILIAFGLSFLDARSPLSFIIGLLVFVAVAAMVGMMIRNGTSQWGGAKMQNIPVRIEKGADVDLASIDIRTNVTNLEISGGAGSLVEGNFVSGYMQLKQNSDISDRKQNVTLEVSNPSNWNPFMQGSKSDLNLKLDPDLPLDMFFDLNVTDAAIDLAEVTAKSVDIKANVSDLTLTLSDRQDLTEVKIKANVGQTKIILPESSGAKVILNTSVSSQALPGFEKISETEYRTSNYAAAAKKVEMNLDINVSDLEIERKAAVSSGNENHQASRFGCLSPLAA